MFEYLPWAVLTVWVWATVHPAFAVAAAVLLGLAVVAAHHTIQRRQHERREMRTFQMELSHAGLTPDKLHGCEHWSTTETGGVTLCLECGAVL